MPEAQGPEYEAAEPAPASWLQTMRRFWSLRIRQVPPSASPVRALAALAVSWLVLWAWIDWRERQPAAIFTLDGVPVLAWYAMAVIALAFMLRKWSTPAPSLGATLVLATGLVPLPLLLVTEVADAVSRRSFLSLAVLSVVYGLLYLGRGLQSITQRPQRKAAVLGVLFVVVFVAVSGKTNAVPDLWTPVDGAVGVSDVDLAARETALFEQADRIDAVLESVQRDAAEQPRGFFLGFAGVGDEKVFSQEIGLAARVIGERYGTAGRQVSLLNDERDLDSAPLASVPGLQYALQGLASRMQLDRDVLFLAISSHGSVAPSIAVSNSQLPFTDLTPQQLADALRDSGIRWRVIVVSACYAGGFIGPLEDSHSIVITAAAADRTSFGCSSDSDLTYFGEAFYRDSLPEAGSLREAFNKARAAIAAREAAEGDEPSEPQAYFGAAAEEHLKSLSDAASSLRAAITAVSRAP